MADSFITILLAGLFATVAVAYLIRVSRQGRHRLDRLDRMGGSALLPQQMMEMAYWCLEPVVGLVQAIGLTPNQLTWGSLGFGAAAGLAMAQGLFGLGAVLSIVATFLDILDGILAKRTGAASAAGAVLDSAVDRYGEFFFLAGVTMYYRGSPVVQLFCLWALFGSFMVTYSTAKAEALRLQPPRGMMRRHERGFYLILGAALSPIPLPTLERAVGLAPYGGAPLVGAVLLVAVMSNISAIRRMQKIAKAARDREQR